MINIIFIIIIILLLLIIYIYYDYYNNLNKICDNLEYFRYGSANANKTILVLGGIHGNEPAGSKAIIQLMNDINMNKFDIKNNNLILIPYVNYCALQINERLIPFIGDLNRKFPSIENYDDNNLHPIIKKILIFVKEADFIIDFHEGWGFYKDNNGSIGSTISPTNITPPAIVDNIYDNINNTITEDNKKFKILVDDDNLIKSDTTKYGKNYEIKNTFRYYANLINKQYVLIETSGQNDIQNLELRISQARIVIDTVIENI